MKYIASIIFMVLLNKSYAVESELSEATRNGKVCMYLKSYRENHTIDIMKLFRIPVSLHFHT